MLIYTPFLITGKDFLFGLSGKESACSEEAMGSIPGLRRSPGEGHGNPFQYSCLEKSMDRGAWWTIVHRVTKHRTQLKQLSMHLCIFYLACRGTGLTTTSY